jgi:magnesium transporter
MEIEFQLLERFINSHFKEAVPTIENLSVHEIAEFLESVPIEWSALLISKMDRYKAAQCLEKMNLDFAVRLIEHLSIPNSEILLRLVNSDFCNIVLDKIPSKTAQKIRSILNYSQNTVGALLNPVFFTVSNELTVKQVLQIVKEYKPSLQQHIYVLDRDQMLVGYIELSRLITTDENESILKITNTNTPKLLSTTNISSIKDYADGFKTFSEIPVVDNSGIFLGVVSKDQLHKLNNKIKSGDQDLYKTGAALGDLYRIGLASFLMNTSEISKK